jgi:asparagine synthase (glutamine-hydrolysing)
MCGIAGYLTLGGRAELATPQVITHMTDAILHRGPDSGGGWQDVEAGIALGMRRLAIIDLTPAGAQPMASADGNYVIVFNGEIYNFQELRARLEAEGRAPSWRGHSDTEVLLAAIDAWGLTSALQAAVGMFALALWDRRERTLSLSIDRFGEKPLYYGWNGNSFLFGSELKSFVVFPGWSGEVDREALSLFLRFAYVPAPHAIYRGIRKLEPGALAVLRLDDVHGGARGPKLSHYWSAREAIAHAKARPLALPEAEAVDGFEQVLAEAVKARMVSDVPLGAFLSGGFDSSAVVAMMQSQSSRPVKTFSIGFTERGYDEAPFAKKVARHLGTDHTEMYVTPRETMDVIPLLPRMYDEPFADSSQIPTYLVAKLARQHVTVALSGDAGDELLGGYARYFISNKTLPTINRLPLFARKLAAGGINALGSDGWDLLYRALTLRRGKGYVGDRALKFANLLAMPSPMDGYRAIISSWQNPNELVRGTKEPVTALNNPAALPSGLSFVEQMMFLDMVSYLPGDILTKVDRATMAVSLEGRVPLLDPALLDFVWRLPLDYKVRGGVGKRLLRQVVYRHIPQSIMDRPKMGFGIPLKDWLRGPLRDWAESLLAPAALADAGLETQPVRLLWQEHLDGNRNWQHMLWPVLMLIAWHKSYRGSVS